MITKPKMHIFYLEKLLRDQTASLLCTVALMLEKLTKCPLPLPLISVSDNAPCIVCHKMFFENVIDINTLPNPGRNNSRICRKDSPRLLCGKSECTIIIILNYYIFSFLTLRLHSLFLIYCCDLFNHY